MHSLCSDGDLSVQKVIDLAVEKGIGMVAITDHDTVNGIEAAKKHAKGKIKLVTGVEITCQEEGLIRGNIPYSIHLLGYAIDEKNEPLRVALIKRQKKIYRLWNRRLKS